MRVSRASSHNKLRHQNKHRKQISISLHLPSFQPYFPICYNYTLWMFHPKRELFSHKHTSNFITHCFSSGLNIHPFAPSTLAMTDRCWEELEKAKPKKRATSPTFRNPSSWNNCAAGVWGNESGVSTGDSGLYAKSTTSIEDALIVL